MYKKSPRRKLFFDDEFKPKVSPNSKGKVRVPGSIDLPTAIKCTDEKFLDLIRCCLIFDPDKRYTPSQALAHEWILEGLPVHLQSQHLKLIDTQSPTEPQRQSAEKNLKLGEEDFKSSKGFDNMPQTVKERDRSEPKTITFTKSATKQTAISVNTSTSKVDLKPFVSQQSLSDLTSIIQKTKHTQMTQNATEEDPSVYNVTINLNDKSQYKKVWLGLNIIDVLVA